VKPTANQLRHRITLQSRSTSNDGFGQEVLTWSDVLTCFASIEPAPRPEQVAGEALVASRTHLVIIRYRPGIAARIRAVYGSRIFEISSVIDLEERHFWLQLDCTEGLTAG
jgi:SPP1 family predicted phage head-tail adaptor